VKLLRPAKTTLFEGDFKIECHFLVQTNQ